MIINRLDKILKDPRNKEQLSKIKEMAPLYQKHQFWDSQPVPHIMEDKKAAKDTPIEVKDVKDVRSAPFPLPEGFEWCAVDLENPKETDEVYISISYNIRLMNF